MEAQQVFFGRGIQRMRFIPGSGYAGTRDSDLWRRRHFRHGRPVHAAGYAVHTALRETNRRLAPGTVWFLLPCK